jgi:4-aminobutyrate aminotransferase
MEHMPTRLRHWLAPSLSEDWPNLPITHAEGSYVYGLDGRRYLDFVSGMAACNLGHRHPRVVAAAKAQIDRLIHGPIGVLVSRSRPSNRRGFSRTCGRGPARPWTA